MNSTALGATNKTENGIMFKSNAHEKFYYEKLKKMQYQDEYHMALCYCLGISDDTRRNIDRIYDFETGCVKPACLYEGWQTSGSKKIVRMAFNLYCNGTPSADSIAWKNCSAVSMHYTSGRQFRSAILSIHPAIESLVNLQEDKDKC